MASEVKLPEPLEEKKASPEVIDLQAISNFISTQNIKEQLGIKSSVVDETTVNEDVDLVKEEIPSVEPSEDVTEKPETLEVHPVNLEEELKELQEEQKCEEAPSPIVETIKGEIENGAHSNQFTEELPPEVVRSDEIPANGTSSSSEEIQEKIDIISPFSNVRKIGSEEVTKEDAPQSQLPENAEADKDVIQSDTATLSDKDCHKEAEIPVGDAKQTPEECVTTEVEIPSTTTPPATEEVSAEAEVKNDILEEVEQERIHQTEVAKENLAEEKDCQDETEDEGRGVSETLTAEETIPEEASREDQAPEMSSEETAKIEETSAKAEMDETGPTDNEETIPHEDSSSNSNDLPITNEENRKGNEESEHLSEEVKEIDVPVAAAPLILEEDKGTAEINEETKEEAQQNQNSGGDEIDKEASQSTPVTDLSESEHQNETEKEIENASAEPEEQIIEKVDLKEVESASVSEEVSEEKENVAEEEQKEQAADETCAEEECPPDAGIQNSDAAELVVSEETKPEEAIPESKTPDPEMQISEEVIPTEDSIGVNEKVETSENDKEEDATEVSGKPDESALETTVSRDVTPEIEITDAEETSTAETDNMDIKKSENEDEEKQNSEEVEQSESSPALVKIEETTPNDCEEEKQGDDKIENIETNDEQVIESCLETEEQLEASKPSTSGEELSSERETIETKPIEQKADEKNVAQDEITLDSKETAGNDDEDANCGEKGDETREIDFAGEHITNDGIKEDEEANKENVEEIPEPTKPSDNTEESTTAELPREEIQLETENDVSPELTKSEEVLPETPSEGTALSEMENIEHKVHDSERDDTEAGNVHETIELKEDEKNNTDEPDETVQDFEVSEKPEEILPGNTVNETTPSIQNEEDPPEKDESINNETTEEEHITEVEASTVVTEVPAEEVQNSTAERSYEIDQLIPETASEQDNLPIASVGSETEPEKPEIGDASSQGEVADSVMPQIDDKSELELEPKEKTEEETLISEEVTQKVEEVEEPCTISHGTEELPEEESTTVHEETTIEPNISTIQQDQQTEESDANPIEADNATDDISVQEGSEANTTVISSAEQTDERSIDKEGTTSIQEENNVEAPNEEAKVAEKLEESTEQIDRCTDPSNVAEVQLSQSETVAPETEILEVTPSEKLEDESNPKEIDAKSAELENTAEKSIVQEEVSSEPSNTRELQIDQTEITSEQDQPSEESEVDATVSESVSEVESSEVIGKLGATVEQIEDAAVPEEEGQKIEAENEKHIEELPQEESTTVHEETSIEPSISTIQQDQETEESDANPIEAQSTTDDISVEEGSEATTTLISSAEQTNERSIDKEETATIQEESNVVAPNEEAKIAEELEESTEQIDECTDPSNVAEVELGQSETVAPETEILEVTPSEKLEDESNPTDMDAKSAESENTAEKSIEQEEVSSEPSNTRELHIDQIEITAEQDQPSEESEVKPTEPDQATEDVPTVENSEVDATVSESVSEIQDQPSEESEVKPSEPDQAAEDVPTVENSEVDATVSESVSEVENPEVIGESGASVEQIEDVLVDKEESVVLQEEDAAVPEEERQEIEAENEKHIEEVTTPSEVTEVELNQTETVPPESKIMEAVSNEVLVDDTKLVGTDINLAESESATEEPASAEPNNTRELQVDQTETIGIAEQDQPSEESEIKPTKPEQVTEDVPIAENSEVDATMSESVLEVENSEVIGESGASVEQIEDVLVDKEEGVVLQEEDASENDKHIEEDPKITTPSEVNQTETVSPETENLEVVSDEVLGDENKHAGNDIKLAEAESAIEEQEPSEEKEIPTEPNNTRELQVDQAEVVAEQDQPSEELEVKPTEPDQAIEEVPTMENLEVDAAVSESAEEIVESSVVKDKSVVLQEDVATEMPEEEATKEKEIEEEVPQNTNPSEAIEVELNQSETVPPKTETLETVSNEGIDDESKLTSSDIKLAEFESATEEPSEEKEIPTEPSNTRELQIDQAEIVAEQDQPSEESEVKPTEPDQATEEVPTMENSEVNATVSESVEGIGEGLVAKEESVVLQEEGVDVEIPEEKAANEKQIEEEVPQITDPSEVSEVELNQSEPVPAETEILKTDKNEELGDENKLAGTDINLAKSESTMEVPIEEKEIPTELGGTRELQTDETEIIAEQDEPGQESDVKPSDSDLATNELSPLLENSEVAAAVSERVEGIGEDSVAKEECVILQEDNVDVKMPQEEPGTKNQIEEEVPQITDPSDVTEVELNQSETVPPVTEILEVVSNEELGDENKLVGTDIKLAEFESTTVEQSEEKEIPSGPCNTRELQVDQAESITEQDQPSQESEVKPTEMDQAIEEVPTVKNLDVDATVSERVEEIGEGVAAEMPEEEATKEKQIEEEVSQITNSSDVSEVKLNQSETVPPETEILEAIPHDLEAVSSEELGDDNKLAGLDIKLAEFKSTTEEPSEEKEITIEPNNARELQVDQAEQDQPVDQADVIAEQDEPSQESEVKPTELDQSIEVPTMENSKVDTTVSESVEEIEETSVAKEESVVLQEEGVDVEIPEEKATNEKKIEEEVPQITDPSEITEVELNQSETVPAETEILEAISNEEFGDENKLAGTNINLVESKDTTEVPTEEKEVPTEPNNTRELQIDQSEIKAEHDEPSQESDVKPTEPDQATEEASAAEKSDIVDDTVIATVEESKEESVIFEEENVAVEMPVEEATNEKQIKPEVTEVVHPSESTEEQPAVTETETETEGDERGLAATELKSDQMENYLPEGLTEEKLDAGVSSGAEQIIVKSEVSELQVEGEEIDAGMIKEETYQGVEAAEEPCGKHIEEEIHRTADPEIDDAMEEGVKPEKTEKEVDPQMFEPQTESPEQEKATEESASVEMSEAGAALVPSETQTEETESGILPQSVAESVTVPEVKISQEIEKNEEEIATTADSEICYSVEVESNTVLNEKELDPPVCEAQPESPEQGRETEESALLVENSVATDPSVPDEGQIEETEIANKEDGLLVQTMPDSVVQPEETISQEVETNEESTDKHIAGEILRTVDPAEISSTAEESKVILTEEDADSQKLGTKTELPEQEETTKESTLMEEKSDATVSLLPGDEPQSTAESVAVPEEGVSQEAEAETSEESSAQNVTGEILRTVDPAEISYTAEEPKSILTEEDADSQKLGTETELPEQEETTEESTLIEEKSDATASLLPSDEPQSTAELVAVPEEIVPQEAETSEESGAQNVTGESTIISNEEEEHSDKLITEIESPDPARAAEELAEEKSADSGNVVPGEGQVEEREIANMESCVAPETENTIESVTVPEERVPQGIETYDEPSDKYIVGEEDKVEQAQITDSPVEQPDSENSGTELESALVEKTNGETDVKANIDEAASTSFEGAVINQTDNESETVPVVEQIHAEDEEAKGHTERDIDATVFLKTPEIAVDETNEHTEETVPNVSEQNKEVEEEANQSEEPEQGFASIVSSFLINKVLSEENQKIDDGTEQSNAASVIPKTSDDEMIQEVTTTRNEPETSDEDVPHATNSTEDLKPEQEQEEESAVKEVREDEQKDGVEQDYLPVSRFLMDKILRQEETKYPEKETETIEEPDKHVISDGGIQVQEDFEENSTLAVAPPEQKGEAPSSYPETARDFETGKTLIGEVGNTSIGDDAISSEEKIEETISVEELPKQGEGNHSPEEVAGELEKEEKLADEALEHIEDENKSLVSDVVEQEGERSVSPAEATRDFDKEDTRIEQKNEEIVPSEDKVEEITGEVAVPMQEEKILYPVQVGEFQHEKPAEEKDETSVSKVTSFTEGVEDLARGEDSKDLVVEETVVNAPEILKPEKIMEENETAVVTQKEEEHKDEAVAGEETPKDVKNVEENYVFVEHEVDQSEETKEVLEEKVTDEVSDAAISNLEEKQTNLSAEIDDEKKSLVGQVEFVERDMADSTENCPKVEQSLPDVPEVPMVTEIVKEHVGNEADFIHGEEQVKEVTGTVESFENKSQEKASEMEAAKMEKKSKEIKDDEQEEDEEEEEEGSRQEREAEITGGDPTVKSEVKETEMKSAQKKSLNILSGVGLKVITFTKVKKAFTGKSFTKVKKAFTGKSKSASPSAK